MPQAGRAHSIDYELEERQMPRIARIKVKGEPTVYHVMSRTALDGFVLGDVETPVESATLLCSEEFNGVKGLLAGGDQAL